MAAASRSHREDGSDEEMCIGPSGHAELGGGRWWAQRSRTHGCLAEPGTVRPFVFAEKRGGSPASREASLEPRAEEGARARWGRASGARCGVFVVAGLQAVL